VVDGVFEEVQSGAAGDDKATSANVIFHLSSGIDDTAMAQAQATLRKRILRAFVGRGLLQSFDTKEMLGYQHSGFSVDAGVCIQTHDRAALERLLRYCARPPFAMERLRKEGATLVYRYAKQHSEPNSDKRSARVDELTLTPLELVERIAALIARIYEVFPLLCPICGGHMRIIAFITHSADIRQILDHIGVESEPLKISSARGSPLWDECDTHCGEGTPIGPDWDLAAQPAPDYEVDQRINW
jgi:hypothetical protein